MCLRALQKGERTRLDGGGVNKRKAGIETQEGDAGRGYIERIWRALKCAEVEETSGHVRRWETSSHELEIQARRSVGARDKKVHE